MSKYFTAVRDVDIDKIFKAVFKAFAAILIVFITLWNWDGFWQTNINWLNKGQQALVPVKYTQEQLKITRITNNNKIIEHLEVRMNDILEKNESLIDKKLQAEATLNKYLAAENKKCRFYDTSLRMIDHLVKKYSEDELKRVLSCTSAECEYILFDRPVAQSICI